MLELPHQTLPGALSRALAGKRHGILRFAAGSSRRGASQSTSRGSSRTPSSFGGLASERIQELVVVLGADVGVQADREYKPASRR